jgi:hypothetical protein
VCIKRNTRHTCRDIHAGITCSDISILLDPLVFLPDLVVLQGVHVHCRPGHKKGVHGAIGKKKKSKKRKRKKKNFPLEPYK